jgi:hypothetical protein
MARAPKHYIIPDSGRLSVTLDLRSLKELRKLSIDLAMPESDLLDLAVASLLQKYRETPIDEIEAKGIECFLSETGKEQWLQRMAEKRGRGGKAATE